MATSWKGHDGQCGPCSLSATPAPPKSTLTLQSFQMKSMLSCVKLRVKQWVKVRVYVTHVLNK